MRHREILTATEKRLCMYCSFRTMTVFVVDRVVLEPILFQWVLRLSPVTVFPPWLYSYFIRPLLTLWSYPLTASLNETCLSVCLSLRNTHTHTNKNGKLHHYFPNTLFSALLGPLLSKSRQADGRTDRTARFEVLAMVLMNIQVFWDVTLRRWVYIDVVERFHHIQGVVVVFLSCLVFNTEVLRSFETSVSTYPTHTMRFMCSANNLPMFFFLSFSSV